MDELINISNTAIDRYFNVLSKFGYKSYDSVFKLILLLHVEELMNSKEFSLYITEDDYRTIEKSLYCLYGNDCLIDFPTYNVYDNLIHENKLKLVYLLTEDDNLRYTEDNNSIRISHRYKDTNKVVDTGTIEIINPPIDPDPEEPEKPTEDTSLYYDYIERIKAE